MSTTFIDTNGEMSFEDNERLKFVIHYLKQGASKELVDTNKSGKFVREDSELSFSEIWLPAARQQQSKVDELQKRVDAAISVLEKLSMLEDEKWREWEDAAEMYAQGESSAYGHAGRMLEQALKGDHA